MHKVLVNCLGDLTLPRKSVVRLSDGPDMTKLLSVEENQQQNRYIAPHVYLILSDWLNVERESLLQK